MIYQCLNITVVRMCWSFVRLSKVYYSLSKISGNFWKGDDLGFVLFKGIYQNVLFDGEGEDLLL